MVEGTTTRPTCQGSLRRYRWKDLPSPGASPTWWDGGVSVVFVLVAVLVIVAAFWFATGRLDAQLPAATHDLRPAERGGEPAFDVVLRGYRMDEVDATVADLRAQIDRLKATR